MGVSIHGTILDLQKLADTLRERLSETAADTKFLEPSQFLATVAPFFGHVEGNTFYTIWNEYYDDYNPASNFMEIIERYYGLEGRGFDIVTSAEIVDYIGEGVNAEDIAEQLGIELIDFYA